MAGFCVTYLFYSYISATLVYFILAIFASSGNLALLVKHYHKDGDTDDIENDEQSDVKSRTAGQYFLASGITLILSIALFILCFRDKNKNQNEYFNQTISLNLDMQKEDVFDQQENEKKTNKGGIELGERQPETNNIKEINTLGKLSSETGMGENDI